MTLRKAIRPTTLIAIIIYSKYSSVSDGLKSQSILFITSFGRHLRYLEIDLKEYSFNVRDIMALISFYILNLRRNTEMKTGTLHRSSPFGLWPHGLLTQSQFALEEQLF